METKDTISSYSETKNVNAIKYKMSKAKERCMAYFRSLHSHRQVLSKEDLKGTRIEHGFKREFMSLFGQDDDTFTSTMLLNMDQLHKQLDKDEFQEDGSMAAFWKQESKVDLGKALDADLVVMESSGTESGKHDTSSRSKTIAQTTSLLANNADLKAQIQEKVFVIAALKNELRKLKRNSVDTKFVKPSVLGKPVLQPLRNQSVV
ncbi:hypothetical protein Tco_0345368 [Tanacetum coccineum]